MEQTIQRWDAAQLLMKGTAYTVEYVECDRKRGTGGKLKKLVNWARLVKEVDPGGLAGHYVSKLTWERQKTTLNNEIIMMHDPDNPMKHPVPVHYWLLCSIDGKRII